MERVQHCTLHPLALLQVRARMGDTIQTQWQVHVDLLTAPPIHLICLSSVLGITTLQETTSLPGAVEVVVAVV